MGRRPFETLVSLISTLWRNWGERGEGKRKEGGYESKKREPRIKWEKKTISIQDAGQEQVSQKEVRANGKERKGKRGTIQREQ